jgi:hypothetical protein
MEKIRVVTKRYWWIPFGEKYETVIYNEFGKPIATACGSTPNESYEDAANIISQKQSIKQFGRDDK